MNHKILLLAVLVQFLNLEPALAELELKLSNEVVSLLFNPKRVEWVEPEQGIKGTETADF